MGANSKIQWTDHTFNPWIGCQKVSEECDHCYAKDNTFVRIQRKEGRELWGNEKRSERHVTSDANWRKPLAWDRQASANGERARVFCASMADVFEDRVDLDTPRDELWNLIEGTFWLDWQLLTKRPENVMGMLPFRWLYEGGIPDNVWVGTSVGLQKWTGRIDALREVPARIRFLSCEPLLGPLDLDLDGIDWVIVGGESGPEARPMDVAWARSLVEQCRRAGVPAFVKQLGRYPCNTTGAYYELSDPKGGDWDEWPEDLRVREMPDNDREDDWESEEEPGDADLEDAGQLNMLERR